jgi:hypothetical protein
MGRRQLPRFVIAALILMASFATGCSKSGQSSPFLAAPASSASATNSGASPPGGDLDLIRQAVEDHVRKDQEINLSAMDMSVDSVNLNGDQAQARVTFRARHGGAMMAMVYSLERHGDAWQVAEAQPAQGQFVHPAIDPAHPEMSPKPAAPQVPDIQEFFRSHPATSGNGR